MTGELTLRGDVLAIAKKKNISSYSFCAKEVIIPKENKKDLIEFQDDIDKNSNSFGIDDIRGLEGRGCSRKVGLPCINSSLIG